MNSSQSLPSISKSDAIQVPLPGLKMEVKSPLKGWRKHIEKTVSGRVRIHMTRER